MLLEKTMHHMTKKIIKSVESLSINKKLDVDKKKRIIKIHFILKSELIEKMLIRN